MSDQGSGLFLCVLRMPKEEKVIARLWLGNPCAYWNLMSGDIKALLGFFSKTVEYIWTNV